MEVVVVVVVVHVPGWFLCGDTCTLVGYICVCERVGVCCCIRIYAVRSLYVRTRVCISGTGTGMEVVSLSVCMTIVE